MNISDLTHINELYYPSEYGDIINGILFGKRFPFGSSLYGLLKEVGLAHMVVFSGTNVTFITGYLLSLLSVFSKKTAVLLTIPILLFFISFLPLEAPIIRATVFSLLTLVSLLVGRKTIGIYLLFLTCIGMILFRPEWIKDISFQLSFAGSLGIMLFIKEKPVKGFKEYIRENIKITLAAEVFIIPLTFLHFKTIALISPLSNLLVAWTIEPLMILGAISVLLGLIWYPLGVFFSVPVFGLLQYFITVVYFLSTFPLASIHLK